MIEDTEEYQNWQAAAADVEFLASEHRPELTAAMTIEQAALKALQDKIKELRGNNE